MSEPRTSDAGGRDSGEPQAAGPGGHAWQVPWRRAVWEAPWAEGCGRFAGARSGPALAMAFVVAVRKTGSLMQLMSQAAADRIGINATDLNCLNILSFSGQMTAGDLARATGLTTASITGVIDRLEQAGFADRERDCSRPPPRGRPPALAPGAAPRWHRCSRRWSPTGSAWPTGTPTTSCG